MAVSLNLYRKRNEKISFEGVSLSIKDWAEKLGISREVLWLRLYRYKLPLEKALTGNKYLQEQKGRKITWGKKISISKTKPWSELKKAEEGKERNSSIYRAWRREVCNRDGWKCKINNKDCSGRLEVHHILGFKDYPELKYEINNGICLCKKHHPRTRIKEKTLINYFKKLIAI